MTITVFPVDAVTGAPEYTGEMLRQALSAAAGTAPSGRPLGASSGVRPGTPTTTVAATSSTWTCSPHSGVLDLEASAGAGPYFYAVGADVTGAVTAANASNPRIDIVYAQLSDPAEGDGTSAPAVDILYLAGTAAASPSVPTTPARSMVLAQINVPKSGGGSPTVTWVAPQFSLVAPVSTADWNTAIASGSYWCSSSAANGPTAAAYVGLVLAYGTGVVMQRLWRSTASISSWAEWQRLYDGTSWTAWVPARLSWQYVKTAVNSIATATYAKMVLDTAVIDSASVGITSGNFVCPVAGVYRVSGLIAWSAPGSGSNSGRRGGLYQVNGTAVPGSTVLQRCDAGTSTWSGPLPTMLVSCSASDTIGLYGYHEQGAALSTAGGMLMVELVR